MSWKCPECKRTFRNVNQFHACEILSPEYHLQRGSENIRELYEQLISEMEQFGPFDLHANKSEIIAGKSASFLGIKIMKSRLKLIFYLDHIDPDPPVEKYFSVSRNRILHEVNLASVENIDSRVMSLLARSYDLIP